MSATIPDLFLAVILSTLDYCNSVLAGTVVMLRYFESNAIGLGTLRVLSLQPVESAIIMSGRNHQIVVKIVVIGALLWLYVFMAHLSETLKRWCPY